jgi:hypothetical protein
MSARLSTVEARSPEGLPIPSVKPALAYRRRTVSEALERVQGAGSPIWKTGKQYPFTKPYAYALQGLTYALILVDPLDRLEGGLID